MRSSRIRPSLSSEASSPPSSCARARGASFRCHYGRMPCLFFWMLSMLAASLSPSCCRGFVVRNEWKGSRRPHRRHPSQQHASTSCWHNLPPPALPLFSTAEEKGEATNATRQPSSVTELKEEMLRLSDHGQVEMAMKLLEDFQVDDDDDDDETIMALLDCFRNVLKESMIHREEEVVTRPHHRWAADMLQKFIDRGSVTENPAWLPTADVFHLVVQSYVTATPTVEGASIKCKELVGKLWSLYHQESQRRRRHGSSNENGKELRQFVPLRDTYFVAIRACSLRDRGVDAAKRAEDLMAEMEALCKEYPELTPDRSIMNEVMNAWSKSGLPYRAGKRCETLLNRMISMAMDDGRVRMTPDTVSFNIAIAALAQGKERDSGSRAEALMYKMENLRGAAGWDCAPDQITYNCVINNWASSRSPGAAERATEILNHMIHRNEAGVSNVTISDVTYSVVLKALAKSNDRNALDHAEEVFEGYRKAVDDGKWGLSHYAITWNAMINCYAKSRRPDSGKKAMELFETMKANVGKPGWEFCFVDKYTYTSLIDAIAKEESYESSERAIQLLEEIEKTYQETGDILFEPNILLYTAVVNAIGRSHKDPHRAQSIVDRVESQYLHRTKDRSPRPDVLFYNALINAYGWSDMDGRSKKSFEVLHHMIDLSKSGGLPDAKPDIISYNSVLNACAYEKTKSQSESDEIMTIVTDIYEDLTSNRRGRGFANPIPQTFVQVLIAISNHMPDGSDKKSLMGEAVFYKCAEDGYVFSQIITVLDQILPRSKFQAIMGDSLDQELHDAGKLSFDPTKLPLHWTAKAQGKGKHFPSTASRKRRRDFQVTKNVLSKMPRQQTTA